MIKFLRKKMLLAILALVAGLARRWWKGRTEPTNQTLTALQTESATP